jgi:hypothetical protein
VLPAETQPAGYKAGLRRPRSSETRARRSAAIADVLKPATTKHRQEFAHELMERSPAEEVEPVRVVVCLLTGWIVTRPPGAVQQFQPGLLLQVGGDAYGRDGCCRYRRSQR